MLQFQGSSLERPYLSFGYKFLVLEMVWLWKL